MNLDPCVGKKSGRLLQAPHVDKRGITIQDVRYLILVIHRFSPSSPCKSQIPCRAGGPPHRTLNIADFYAIAHDANLNASRENSVGTTPFPVGPLGSYNSLHGYFPRSPPKSVSPQAPIRQ